MLKGFVQSNKDNKTNVANKEVDASTMGKSSSFKLYNSNGSVEASKNIL